MTTRGGLAVGMKTVSEFFGIPETDFDIFRSDSPVTVFFENGIGFRNFLSESVSESVSESAWCFTDSFLRLPVFVGNYQICVSEFSGIVSLLGTKLSTGRCGPKAGRSAQAHNGLGFRVLCYGC